MNILITYNDKIKIQEASVVPHAGDYVSGFGEILVVQYAVYFPDDDYLECHFEGIKSILKPEVVLWMRGE